MSSDRPGTDRVLVLAWGNPGRRDDGLGPALAEAIEARGTGGVTIEVAYQLQLEHAALVAEHDLVVFADAAADGPAPFSWRPLEPFDEIPFTTHAFSPGAVLALAGRCYGARPRAFLLGVRGEDFSGFGEGLSPAAARNLQAAVDFLDARLRGRTFDRAAAGDAPPAPSPTP